MKHCNQPEGQNEEVNQTIKIGDIAIYKQGIPFLFNEVVYVEDLRYGGGDKISVCTLTPWNVPLNWSFGVPREELIVICRPEQPTQDERCGNSFSPEWLKKTWPVINKARQAYLKK